MNQYSRSGPLEESMDQVHNNHHQRESFPPPPSSAIAFEKADNKKLIFLGLLSIPSDNLYSNILLHATSTPNVNSENHLIENLLPLLSDVDYKRKLKHLTQFDVPFRAIHNNHGGFEGSPSLFIWPYKCAVTGFFYVQLAEFIGPVTDAAAQSVINCLDLLINENYTAGELAKIPTSYTINDRNQANLQQIITAYNTNNLTSLTSSWFELDSNDKYDRADGFRTIMRRSTVSLRGPSINPGVYIPNSTYKRHRVPCNDTCFFCCNVAADCCEKVFQLYETCICIKFCCGNASEDDCNGCDSFCKSGGCCCPCCIDKCGGCEKLGCIFDCCRNLNCTGCNGCGTCCCC